MSDVKDLMGAAGVILATRGGNPKAPTAPDSGPFNGPIVTYSPEAAS